MGYRNYSVANGFVVDQSGNGDFTTIGAALNAALSGTTIFIRPGTYTENPTLKAGINLVAFTADGVTPNVVINGNCTANFTGTVGIAGIRLQTNSNNFLTVSGSNATIVNVINCFFNCTNNTGISFSSSSSSAQINITSCTGNLATTGIGLFSHSSAGFLTILWSRCTNTGNSTTTSTISGTGVCNISWSNLNLPIAFSSSSTGTFDFFQCDTSATNTTCVALTGTSSLITNLSSYASGTASCLSAGAGTTLNTTALTVNSTNANPVTGAGTLDYTPFNFQGTGQGVNVTTRTPLNFGSWTPTVDGTVSGATTYTTQKGLYTIIGNLVYIEAEIVITAATGTGNALFGGFPFTVKNIANYSPAGNFVISSTNWTWPANTTQLIMQPETNTTQGIVSAVGSAHAAFLQMTNGASTFAFNALYQI